MQDYMRGYEIPKKISSTHLATLNKKAGRTEKLSLHWFKTFVSTHPD